MTDPMVVLAALTSACDTIQRRLDAMGVEIAHERKNIDQLIVSLETLRRIGEEVFKVEDEK